MATKSGIIIDNNVFVNAKHIIKLNKYNNDYGTHWIEVDTIEGKKTYINFETKEELDIAFDKIIDEIFGDCLCFNKQPKK